MRIKVSTVIAASTAEVWSYLETIERHVEWMADAESIEFTTRRTSGVGASFICVTKVGPFRLRDQMTVTQWRPGRAMGIEHTGLVTGAGVFTLSSRRNGTTRFVWKERLRFPWYMGGPIGALAAKPVLRMIWKHNLRRLKTRCENGA